MHVFIDTTDIIKLQEANNNIKLQRIMFASSSHEFRTPLNAIINSYDFIAENYREVEIHLPESQELDAHRLEITKFLKIGKNSSTLLLALVEDILDLSKIEAGTFKVNLAPFNIVDLLKEVHMLFSNQ